MTKTLAVKISDADDYTNMADDVLDAIDKLLPERYGTAISYLINAYAQNFAQAEIEWHEIEAMAEYREHYKTHDAARADCPDAKPFLRTVKNSVTRKNTAPMDAE